MAAGHRDFSEKSSLSNVLYMGVPSMLGFAAINLYAVVDIFWVGLLGSAQVAALTLFQAFQFVLSSTNMLVGAGSVAVISRRFGEKDYEAAQIAIKQTIILKIIIAAAIGVGGFFVLGNVLSLMHAEPDVMQLGIEYGRYFFFGLPMIYSSFTIFSALRGIGQAPKAMHVMMMTAVFNVILDPVFIFDRLPVDLSVSGLILLPAGTRVGFGLGMKGAAVARAASALVCVIVGLCMLRFGKNNLRFRLTRGWRPDFRMMGTITRIGVPPGLENIVRTVANAAMASFVGLFGTFVVAFFGFAFRILRLTTVFAMGMSLGTAAMVGIYLGGGAAERASDAVKKSAWIVLAIVGAIGAGVYVWADGVMRAFAQDATVVAEGITALRIMMLGHIMLSVRLVVGSAFTGSGNTWPPMVVSLIVHSCQIALTAILIQAFGTDQTGIWWAFSILTAVGTLMVILWFNKGKWKSRRV